ncbi:uncharacterized protein ATNIH1004_010853 [Aspergillus tanneri]|uniref:Alcohol dehydrogenase-like N-terminal domain-containing protein n=1 Tax=Aspergillus tanneri TaxID=1220188 RepID=A0A5M9M9F0_9EURO|nr:uncharacterized protein ATNIH1004_010853 [Aspergillus tanneri]KAA8641914.1 hypothetical protein ATNIH1004_010853 [Aspergillus tanneri]
MGERLNTSLVVQIPEGHSPNLMQEDLPLPSPGSRQALVKLSHAAQNPTDDIDAFNPLRLHIVRKFLSFDANTFGDGAVLGCDFVGELVELGNDVRRIAKDQFPIVPIFEDHPLTSLGILGDIEGLVAYTQYTLASERLCFKVPKTLSRECASTVPLAAATA